MVIRTLEKLLGAYEGEYAVIHGDQVIVTFDSQHDAVTSKGTFKIRIKHRWGLGFTFQRSSCFVQLTFLVDYPAEISPLAKRRKDEPRLTYRFELFING